MNPLQRYNFVQERIQTIPLGTPDGPEPDEPQIEVEAVPCESISELLETYERELHMTDDIRSCLYTMLATVLSTTTYGGQLGLRVIGRPGSAKSTLAEAISCAREYVYPRSKFTGIISGWSSVKKGEQTAEKFNGKCVMVKDADTMLQLPNLAQVESEIRDALGDGVIRGEYRTGKEFEIETVFTMIQCGTKVLRSTDSALLGSRFLDVVIHGEEGSEANERIVRRSIRSQANAIASSISTPSSPENNLKKKKSIEALGGPTVGFLQHARGLIDEGVLEVKDLTEAQEGKIAAIADIIAFCRAKVERSQQGYMKYRPEKELATRLSEQFTRLAYFLAIVFLPKGRHTVTVTKRVFTVLKKVFRDTAYGFPFEIIDALYEVDKRHKEPTGMDKDTLAHKLHISASQTYSILQDMKEIGIIRMRAVANPHGKGRKAHFYVLTPELRKLYKEATQ